MATRRRTLLFTCALVFGAAVVPAAAAAARPAQDGGASFGGVGAQETTITLPASTTAPTTNTTEGGTNQTLVESEESPDQPLFTENRKVAAVIGGLIFVALAILLLTIRYWKVTKPVPAAAEEGLPMLPPTLELNDESVFVVASDEGSQPVVPTVPPLDAEPAIEAPTAAATAAATAGTDHDAADDDWEPRTGEHERVEIQTGATVARPSLAARRKTLGVDG